MRILLLQARRPDDPMLDHERRCFVEATHLPSEAFDCVNLIDRVPSFDELAGVDALMVGGAGHFSVTDPSEPFYGQVRRLLRRVIDRSFPTFASCFGFQLFVEALGGEVIHDPDRSEVGSYSLRLTDAGRSDELFSTLPDLFTAQMGHMDRATSMPGSAVNLAASERSPVQALRIPGRPIWASQFHPELSQKANYERYRAYLDRYGPAGLGEEEGGFVSLPSPEASTLLPAFLDLVRGS